MSYEEIGCNLRNQARVWSGSPYSGTAHLLDPFPEWPLSPYTLQ